MGMGIRCRSTCERAALLHYKRLYTDYRHESARGPTTTAKFNLMEPEELMNQEFNSDDW